jgi:hypothetical protein
MLASAIAVEPLSLRPTKIKGGIMKIILKLLLAGCALALAGCGTIQTSTPMPSVAEKLSVTAVSQPLGLNDIYLGTYRVPDSAFAVLKYKEVSKTAGAFGAAGILAAHSSGADDSKAMVDGVEGIFRLDMAAETMRVMKGLRAQGHGSPNLVLDGAADGGTLRLLPHAYLTTKDGSNARLYVFLKVQLLDKRGSEQWWTRYTYYVPGEHPIKGRGSWSANNGQLLREKLAEGLAEAGKVFLKTSSGGQASAWNEKPVRIKMKAPGLDDMFTLDGTVLQQTDKTVIVSPKISTAALFYGVSIIPRNEVELSPL